MLPGSAPRGQASPEFLAFYEREFVQGARSAWVPGPIIRTCRGPHSGGTYMALLQRHDSVENRRGFVHRGVVNRARTGLRDESR